MTSNKDLKGSSPLEETAKDELGENPRAIGQNPLYQAMKVSLTIPETIRISMVDANSLGDFEIWAAVVSILCNFFVGFIVAWIGCPESTETVKTVKDVYFGVTICFGLLLVGAVIVFITKVLKLHRGKKSVNARLTPED